MLLCEYPLWTFYIINLKICYLFFFYFTAENRYFVVKK